MPILIVDDDATTRQTLSHMLHRLGHKTVIEAREGLEALRILELNPQRFHMIVVDLEMPLMGGLEFLKRIESFPELQFCPFLMISSDASRRKLQVLQSAKPRLDGILPKPFRAKPLEDAMALAYRRRAETRNQIIHYALAPRPELDRAVSVHSHWRAVTRVSTPEALEQAVKKLKPNLGAIFIEPDEPGVPSGLQVDDAWFKRFKKAHWGSKVKLISLTRDPSRVFSVRTYCQRFNEPPYNETKWARLLTLVEMKVKSSWELEHLATAAKAAMLRGESASALKSVRAMLKRDPTHCEAHVLMGELFQDAGKADQASAHYRASIRGNPCQPRPYLKLFELHETGTLLADSEFEQAPLFCPENTEILLRCARHLRAAGDTVRSEQLLRRSLELNPGLSEAQSLLDPEASPTA